MMCVRCVLLDTSAEDVNEFPVENFGPCLTGQPSILSSGKDDVIHFQQFEILCDRMIMFSEIRRHWGLSRMPWDKDKAQTVHNSVSSHHFKRMESLEGVCVYVCV